MNQPSISSETVGPGLIIRLGDEFMVFPDQFDPILAAVESALETDSETKSIRTVVLNCEHVAHLSSVSLGKMVALQKSLKRDERALRLCGLNEDLQKIMQVTQLDKVFDVFDDEATALA